MRSLLLLSSVFTLGIAASSSANASGFGIKLNSTILQGQANAGSAVIADPLTMYNNPAILSQIERYEAALSATGIMGSVKYEDSTGVSTGNVFKDKFTPTGSAAFAARIHSCAVLGLSVSTPYGLAFKYPHDSLVKNYVVDAEMKSVAISPSLAIKVNPMLTLGAGMDFQWTDVKFSNYPAIGAPFGVAKGDDWHVRGTFGVLIEPTKDIRFGVSVKTRSTAKLSGDYKSTAPLVSGAASAHITFPTTITVSGSYAPTKEWTVYGDVIRTQWSSISEIDLKTPNGSSAIVEGWKDSTFYSVGADYKFNEKLTLRGGLGVDHTPTDDATRVPGIPDSNKVWLALGGSYEMNNWKFSLSYGHEFFKKATINQAQAGKAPINGKMKEHVDLVSFQINYKF